MQGKTTPTPTPQAGDVVIIDTDDYYAAKRGDRGVIDAGLYGDERIGFVLKASVFRDERKVSASGGPCPCIEADSLTYAGRTTQRFWNWAGRLPGRDQGVEYEMEVNAWKWSGERVPIASGDTSGLRSWLRSSDGCDVLDDAVLGCLDHEVVYELLVDYGFTPNRDSYRLFSRELDAALAEGS
jgi:hypothetical protein